MKMSIYFGPSLLEKAPPQVYKGAVKEGAHGRDVAVGKLSRLFYICSSQAGIFNSAAS